MVEHFVRIRSSGHDFADTPIEKIAALIGQLATVSVSVSPPQTLNVTRHTVGVIRSISWNDHDAEGGRPGEGSVVFDGRTSISWSRYDTVTIETKGVR